MTSVTMNARAERTTRNIYRGIDSYPEEIYHFLKQEDPASIKLRVKINQARDTMMLCNEIREALSREPFNIRHYSIDSLFEEVDRFREWVKTADLSSIKELHLNNINLVTLPSEIKYLTNLTWLDLDNNALRTLPPEIGALKQLKRLDVDFNELVRVPKELKELTKLQGLYITSNRLTSKRQLRECLPPQIKTVDKRDNPWHS